MTPVYWRTDARTHNSNKNTEQAKLTKAHTIETNEEKRKEKNGMNKQIVHRNDNKRWIYRENKISNSQK